MDHSVNVLHFAQARASEIASLMSEVNSPEKSKKKAWFQNLPHHMRRRGASQNPKRVPRNLRVSNQTTTTKPTSKGKRHKKQPKDIKVEYANRSKPDRTWLENHIWHAKRFKMKTLWGYQLPFNSNDSKIGSSHDAASNRCMLQDLSYYCCIELSGIQENILSHLSVLTDSLAGHTFASEMFLDGSKEGHSFLYHPKSYPYKAIGPVTFIWRPVLDEKTHEYETEIPDYTIRRLWIWCHPSFHDELVQVLVDVFDFKETTKPNPDASDVSESNDGKITNQFTFACKLNFTKNQQHFRKEKTFTSNEVQMVLRKNTLVRHRLIGPMSLSILTQVLRQADVADSSTLSHVEETSNESSAKRFKAENTNELDAEEKVPSSQLWWESFYKSEHQKQYHDSKGELLDCLKDPQSSYYVTPRSVIGLTVSDPRIELGWREGNVNGSAEENGNGSTEEVSNDCSEIDALLTLEAADSALWPDDIRNEVTATKLSDQEINKERSNTIGPIDLGKKGSRIPIIIIHQNGLNGFGSGWDFIAPLGWSLEFWRSFQRKGCRPAGLRDLHFVNLEAGCPSFPCSYPDTDAGAEYEEKIRLEALAGFHKRPKSKRPNFSSLGVSTPFYMCWKTLIQDWEKHLVDSDIRTLFPSVDGLSMEKDIENGHPVCGGRRDYFVFRQKELRQLGSFCTRLNKIPRSGITETVKEKLTKDLDSFVTSIHPQMQFSKSLVGLKIHCLNKGIPSAHSRLYLLSDDDIREVKDNFQFCGPTESSHKKPNEQNKSLERPKIDSLISVSSRKIIGYISEGGFSGRCARGYGIGYCSSVAFMVVLKQCLEAQLRPFVLMREQHCFKYRVANVEIIEYH